MLSLMLIAAAEVTVIVPPPTFTLVISVTNSPFLKTLSPILTISKREVLTPKILPTLLVTAPWTR